MPSEPAAANLGLLLARRLMTHGENRFARFVMWVSFIGLTLGVMILTVVITVMNGFDAELKSRLLRSIPHVTVRGAELTDDVAVSAQAMDSVASVNRYFQGLGALSVQGEVQPISLYASDQQGLTDMAFLRESIQAGQFQSLLDDPTGLILGAPLARYLGLQIGDPLVVLAVENSDQGVAPKLLRFNLVATFELGAEPDYGLAVIQLDRLTPSHWRQMGAYGLQIQLHDPLMAGDVAQKLHLQHASANIESWEVAYGELFQAVRLEKSMMFLLLLLVVAIASFNIIAGQTMVVNDKRASIAILRTMGCTQGLIRQVFLLQGVCIGVAGTIIGLLLGLAAAFNINVILRGLELISGMHLLDGSFFVEVPVKVLPADLALIGLMSCGLCLLSAWSPARRAALMDPVQALH